MENPQMLREIANDKNTPKKTDLKVENDLYENDGLDYENDVFVPCDIYDRDRLAPGSSINGPAILEGMDSTVLINPGWTGQIDKYGNCIMEPI